VLQLTMTMKSVVIRMTTTRAHQTFSLRPATDRDLAAIERLLEASSLPRAGVADNLETFDVAESGGRQLVERVIAEAEARGIRALYLLTTTAEHYFPSFGLTRTTRDAVPEEVQATAEFQGACLASAVVMSRALAAVSS
jgi:amino-acid N-acetyltransferase